MNIGEASFSSELPKNIKETNLRWAAQENVDHAVRKQTLILFPHNRFLQFGLTPSSDSNTFHYITKSFSTELNRNITVKKEKCITFRAIPEKFIYLLKATGFFFPFKASYFVGRSIWLDVEPFIKNL